MMAFFRLGIYYYEHTFLKRTGYTRIDQNDKQIGTQLEKITHQ